MAIAWVTTKIESHLIEALRAVHWEVRSFSPAEFLQAKLSQLGYVDAIIFDLTDGRFLDLCRQICRIRIAPVLVVATSVGNTRAAMECGAADFLVEPIDPIDGVFRVRRLARAPIVAKRVGQTVAYAELMPDVWELDPSSGTLAQVKSYVGRVRRKIELDPRHLQHIISIPGEGYRLRNHRQWQENQRIEIASPTY